MTTKKATKGFQLELLVDGVPYEVRGHIFDFNDEKRVQLNVNNGTDHIYAWDPDTVGLRALDDDAILLPDNLEQEISEHLVKTVIASR
ncbi:MAG: hypothetical protein DI535_06110 [Citrobacter freundii]|nr:MAG: hypothetical protein DI535_06110 [Citrobacter freundii]